MIGRKIGVSLAGKPVFVSVAVSRDAQRDGDLVVQLLQDSARADGTGGDGAGLDVDVTYRYTDLVLSAVARWILDLDFQAGKALGRGRLITRRVPAPDPIPLRAPGTTQDIESYRALRAPSETLIRPMLIPAQPPSLLDYQNLGVDWLVQTQAGILADDMGLGKTVQATSAFRTLVESGIARDALVVAPRSLLGTWEDELTRWAPGLTRVSLTPEPKIRDAAWHELLGRVHLIVTSYEAVRAAQDILSGHRFDVVIVDEAHRARNLDAGTSRAIRRLVWQRFWALTGTPIERDVSDLLTILSTLAPNRFSVADAKLPASVVRTRAKPYVLRRLKADVLSQLPTTIESKEILELLPAQRSAYRRALGDEDLRETGSPSLLEVINRLRTICDYDPSTGESVKVNRILEIVSMIRQSSEKCVIFSYLLKPLDLLQDELTKSAGFTGVARLDGAQDLEQRSASIKSFQSDARVTVLLASSRVGGEGLTLTEANHVVFFNEWWNPSANSQARDRVVRIGQTRGVRVYHFRCRDTIEDALERILVEKATTVDEVVNRLARSPDSYSASDSDVLEHIRRELIREEREIYRI